MSRRRIIAILALAGVAVILLMLAGIGFFVRRETRQEQPAPVPAPARVATPRITAKPKKAVTRLRIQGFRIGMTLKQAEALLRKKHAHNFKTDLADLFIYDPAPGVELALSGVCTRSEPVLGRVTKTMAFGAKDGPGLRRLKQRLISTYGKPAKIGALPEELELCWGKCARKALGTRLTARTTTMDNGGRGLALVLENEGLFKHCASLRQKKISRWLDRWAVFVQKFEPGVSLDEASTWYRKRYHVDLMPCEEREESDTPYTINDLIVREYDFFPGLDYESQSFEGAGPGSIVLKFTGGQSGQGALDKRLYFASFSTTTFTDKHVYNDVRKKLDLFIRGNGYPDTLRERTDGVDAIWELEQKRVKVSILDSGLITFEQSDLSYKDMYQAAVINKLAESTMKSYPSFTSQLSEPPRGTK